MPVPSFGAEAARLATVWSQVTRRLGPDGAAAAAAKGRQMTFAQAVDEALAEIDGRLSRIG